MSLDTLVSSVPVTLPRVNLLPQEINEANAARRLKVVLAAGLAVVVAGVGFVYVSAGGAVTEAQQHLDQAQSTTTSLRAEVARHNTVTPLKLDVQSRTTLLLAAMSGNIPWAFYMNDMQLGLPSGVRLVTWQMQSSSAGASGPATAFGSNGVATWTITGEAKRFEDVALVVESLQQLDAVDSVFVTKASSVVDQISGQPIIQWTATCRLNNKALRPFSAKLGG
jgi:Tfp pilus assembly protein PilN